MNQFIPSGNITYNVGYLFYLLLICISEFKRCNKTGWYNIEYFLFILHWLIITSGSKNPELWKMYHIIYLTSIFQEPKYLKNSKGANIIIGNISCNFPSVFKEAIHFKNNKAVWNIPCWLLYWRTHPRNNNIKETLWHRS